MKNPMKSKHDLRRRDLIKGVAAAGLGLAAGGPGSTRAFGHGSVSQKGKQNRIQKENAKSGTRDWLLTKTDITANEPEELWRSPRIEGYCSATHSRSW